MSVVLGLVVITVMAAGCGDSNTGSQKDYSACQAVPAGSQTASGCPGAVGTWNAYKVVKNSGGTVTSIQVWCGGGDSEHYGSQASYDASVTGGTSNNDYVESAWCASASKTLSGGGTETSIWQKQ